MTRPKLPSSKYQNQEIIFFHKKHGGFFAKIAVTLQKHLKCDGGVTFNLAAIVSLISSAQKLGRNKKGNRQRQKEVKYDNIEGPNMYYC